jgi:hypothetical protein
MLMVSFKDKTATGFPARSRDFLPYPKDLDVLWEPPSIIVQGTVLRPAAFSNGRLGASQHWRKPVMFVLVLCASVNTVDLVSHTSLRSKYT